MNHHPPPTKPPTAPLPPNEQGQFLLSPRLEARSGREQTEGDARGHEGPVAQGVQGSRGSNGAATGPAGAEAAPPTDRPRTQAETAHDARPRQVYLRKAQRDAGCFYCGRTGHKFDADHSPLPYRHGGAEAVAACKHCHSLKDRFPVTDWAPSELDALEAGMTTRAAIVIACCHAVVVDGEDFDIDPDSVVRAAATCTTPEARIAVYKAFNAALDAATKEPA